MIKKIIGIFLMMLLIGTAIQTIGIINEAQQMFLTIDFCCSVLAKSNEIW